MSTNPSTAPISRFDRWQRDPSDIKETLGFFVVMLLGLWSSLSTNQNTDFGLATIAFWFSFGLFFAVFFGNDDNHFNPLITLGAWIAGMFVVGRGVGRSTIQVIVRIFEGIIAAVAAIFVVWSVFHYQMVEEDFGSPGHGIAPWWARIPLSILIYFMYTFASLWVIDHNTGFGRWDTVKKAFFLAVLLGVGIYYAGKYVGGGVNTTRELIPELFGWDLIWIPILFGPPSAMAAGLVYRLIRRRTIY